MTLDELVLKKIPAILSRIRIPAAIAVVVTVIGAIGFGYVAFGLPYRTAGPEQPIAFSHRLHVGVKEIDCRFCHPFVERGPRAGIPAVGKCLYCHNFIIPEHPEIAKEHAYYNTGEPVPWKRVFFAFDHVQFRHQPHLLFEKPDGTIGLDCQECHGAVETMDRLPYVEFKMGFCINCHRKYDANQQCWLACHN